MIETGEIISNLTASDEMMTQLTKEFWIKLWVDMFASIIAILAVLMSLIAFSWRFFMATSRMLNCEIF